MVIYAKTIAVVGIAGVGKTCFLHRLVNNRFFERTADLKEVPYHQYTEGLEDGEDYAKTMRIVFHVFTVSDIHSPHIKEINETYRFVIYVS